MPRPSASAPSSSRSRSIMTRLASTSRLATVSSSATAKRVDAGRVEGAAAHLALLAAAVGDGARAGRRGGPAGRRRPTGPPILWALTVIRSAPLSSKRTGRWATACTASVWNGTPCSRATAASSATGCTVPTSLLAHMTLATATPPGAERLAQAVDADVAAAVGLEPADRARPRASARYSTGSSTAWCSMPLATTPRRARGRLARRASQAPLTARLSDSVPPEVKTTSDGRAPSAAPIRSRASSTTARAARPEVCSDEGLPTTADCSIRASSAAGSIGVVAAWSR